MKCHVRIEITHSKRGVMQGFTTHSALETLRLRLRVTNIAIRCKTLHNPTLVVCYFYNKQLTQVFYHLLSQDSVQALLVTTALTTGEN